MARFNSALTSNTITGASTIGSPYNGAFTEFTGTAPYTVTLPSPGLYPGINQTYYNATSGIVTLSTPSGTFAGTGGPGTSTVSVYANNVINVVSDGTNYIVISEDGSPLVATTASFSGNVTMNGGSATVTISPSTLTVAPTASSTIDNVAIGSTTKASGAFTTLTSNNSVTFTAGTASSSTGTGTLVVTGGIGASGTIYAGGFNGNLTGTLQTSAQPNITSTGSLTAPGLTIDTTTLYVDATNHRVGIGTTSPAADLHVTSSAYPTVSIRNNSGASGWPVLQAIDLRTSGGSFQIESGRTLGALSIRDNTATADRFIINASGNFGFNTTSNLGTNGSVSIYESTIAKLFLTDSTLGTSYGGQVRGYGTGGAGGQLEIGVVDANVYNQGLKVYNQATAVTISTNAGANGTVAERFRIAGTAATFNAGMTVTVPDQNAIKTTGTVYPITRPNLVLDFANSKGFDARITFTRNSVGTYYDETGVLRTAQANQPRIDYDPVTLDNKGLLIEESRANAHNGDNGTFNVTVFKNQALAPDGTWTAVKVVTSTANAYHGMTFGSATIPTSGYSTISFYAKKADAVGDTNNTLYIEFSPTYTGASWQSATWNLNTGVTSSNGSVTSTMTNVGNGWYRCSITRQNSSGGSIGGPTILYTLAGGSSAGDQSTGVYVWGVQSEIGAFPTSYIPPTQTFNNRNSTATYYDSLGILRIIDTNRPRYAYSYNPTTGQMVSAGLIIEPSSTNLISYAINAGSTSPWYYATGYTNNTSATTDPTGFNTAVQISHASVATPYVSSAFTFGTNSRSTLVISLFVKPYGSVDVFSMWCDSGDGVTGATAQFKISTLQTQIMRSSNSALIRSTQIVVCPNGWYRIIMSVESPPTNAQIRIYSAQSNFGVNGDGYGTATGSTNSSDGFYAWGWQAEYGYVATSFMPTSGGSQTTRSAETYTSSAVTRAVDNAVMYNMGNILNSTQGTVVSTWESQGAPTAGGVPGIFELLPAGNATGGIDQRTTYFYYGDNYALSTGGYTYNSGYTTRAIAYQTLNTKIFTNGALIASDTVHTTVATLDKVLLGGIDNAVSTSYPLNGHIKRLVYYPKRLTDTEVIALTTQ
jgi:hypothetical protein